MTDNIEVYPKNISILLAIEYLFEQKEEVLVRQLAKVMNISESNVSLRTRILVAKKLIRRREGERGKPHRLTSEGKQFLSEWKNSDDNSDDHEEFISNIKEGYARYCEEREKKSNEKKRKRKQKNGS